MASGLMDQAPLRLMTLIVVQAILLTTPVWLVERFAGSVASPFTIAALKFLIDQIVFALTTGAIVTVAYAAARRERCGIIAALHASVARFWPMLVVSVAQEILFQGEAWLFYLAGLAVLVLTAVAGPVCMIERRGALASLRRSLLLTRGNRLRIVGLLVVVFLVVLAMLSIGGLLYAALTSVAETSALHGVLVVVAAILGLIGLLAALATIVIATLMPVALYIELLAIEARAARGEAATAPP